MFFSSTGSLDPVASAIILKENGKISFDVILIFDEIYIQRCEEYSGGASLCVDENGSLYNGVVCLMIAGLARNIPYVLQSIPKQNLVGDWLRDAIL